MFAMVLLAICALQIGAIICSACLARKVKSHRKCSSVNATGEEAATAEGGEVKEEVEIEASAE